MSLLSLEVARTTGLDGFRTELIADTRKQGASALSKASTPLARQMRTNLSRRRRGQPAPPGESPGRVTGALRDTVGKDRPRRDGDVMSVAVGIGVGVAKARRVEEWKAKGINVFEYGPLQEHGGVFHKDGRRYPARPFARPAEESTEAEIERILREVLA